MRCHNEGVTLKITRKQLKSLILESLGVQYQIYCDMDGVIADFNTGVVLKMNEYLSFAADGGHIESKSLRKGITKVLKAFGQDFRVPMGSDIDAVKLLKRLKYSVVVQDPGQFFYSLPKLVDGTDMLWPFITSLGITVNILSAPINSTKGMPADQGKRMWVQENLSPQPVEVVIVPAVEKQNYAVSSTGTPNILIDDKEETILEWNARGGLGILHVTGNSQQTIQQLQILLNS